jgi:alpha-L-fucosidase
MRIKDLVDKYEPDLLYTDGALPFEDYGLSLIAHHYNANAKRNGGKTQAVYTSKRQLDASRGVCVLDVERGVVDKIWPHPWQTDTCIGDWHYSRARFEQHNYKSAATVITRLCDIVSKNGNLLLSIPLRGDGTIDADERQVLEQLAAWMRINDEAIFGTRPWHTYGEGPTKVAGGMFAEDKADAFTGQDIRYTTKGETLYAIALGRPASSHLTLKSLASNVSGNVERVEMLGMQAPLRFKRDTQGLTVELPENMSGEQAVAFKILGRGLGGAA